MEEIVLSKCTPITMEEAQELKKKWQKEREQKLKEKRPERTELRQEEEENKVQQDDP